MVPETIKRKNLKKKINHTGKSGFLTNIDMFKSLESLKEGYKVYFASDMHLGVPDHKTSLKREKKLIRWLTEIQNNAQAIFLLGDIFDFWFEYKHVVPKGYVRLLGKLAELSDKGVEIYLFTGNHDMWMFDYFPKELGIPVLKKPVSLKIHDKKFFLGHGDGLGSGDFGYKIIKRIFSNKLSQWAFARIHPNLGIKIAQYWSRKSREKSNGNGNKFLGDKEWLYNFCKEMERNNHHDYYIFGHRHFPIEVKINTQSTYFNLGEWIDNFTYGVFDGSEFKLLEFEKH